MQSRAVFLDTQNRAKDTAAKAGITVGGTVYVVLEDGSIDPTFRFDGKDTPWLVTDLYQADEVDAVVYVNVRRGMAASIAGLPLSRFRSTSDFTADTGSDAA